MSKLSIPVEQIDQRIESPGAEQELPSTTVTGRDESRISENFQYESLHTRPACERIKDYKMRNLRISQMRRQGIPMAAIRAAGNAVQKQAEKKAQDALGLSSAKNTEVEQAIRELWIRKRQEEEQDRKSEQDVKEAMLWWSKNRARTEEEISRRQESIRFSSQTARLHGRPDSEASTIRSSSVLTSKVSTFVATGEGGGTAGGAGEDGFVATDDDDEDIEIIEDLMYEKYVLPDRFLKTPQLKAPYDGLRTSSTTAGWALTSPARPISARLAGRAPGAMHNFGSPRPTSASAASAARTLRSHSARARVTSDSQALGATISSYPQGGGVPRGGPSQPYELHGFSSPHRASASRPPSHQDPDSRAGSPRRGGGAGEAAGGGGPEVAARVLQLAEVDRIKRCFAKNRIVCSLNVIERALTIPNDRCYAKCVDLLPRPGAHLLTNPVARLKEKGKKGGKKGKKKGKKKG